jgi:hypothetical protein
MQARRDILQPSRSTLASKANISALLKDKKLATGAPVMRQRRPLT